MDLVVLVIVLFVVVVVSVALDGAASRRAKAIEARSDSDRAHELLEAMKRMTPVASVCGVVCGGAAYTVLLAYGTDAVNWGSGLAQVVAAVGGFAGAGLAGRLHLPTSGSVTCAKARSEHHVACLRR